MRLLAKAGRSAALLGGPLVVIAFLGSAFASPANERVIVNFFITLVLALSIQSFSGNSGIVSFGHVGFMGVGAYVAALVTIPPTIKGVVLPSLPGFISDVDLGFLPSVLLAAGVGALVAAVLGAPLSRMREGAMTMATISVLVIFFVLFDNWDELTRGSQGLFGIPRSTTIWWAAGFAVLTIALVRAFRESNVGSMLRASRADPVAAEALGANVVLLRWAAWTFSGFVMGLGGGVWAEYNIAFGPRQFFFALTFSLLAVLVVGGLGSVSGVVVGAVIVTAATEIMRRIEDRSGIGGLANMAVALMILLVLYRRPDGVLGRFELDDLLGRRLARRRARG
ncbi:MAG TPA: branched-chain amino acid ABC transporter permease [Gaiellaceae bacterium]